MSSPSLSPPSPAEITRWAHALQARVDADPASAPMRYLARGLLETGWVRMASYLSPLLPKIPEGFSKDCLVLRVCTSVRDEPLQWPRTLLRLRGHVLEGRTPDMDPVEPALWTLTLLPPKEAVPTGFIVDLIGFDLAQEALLVDPSTGQPPRATVPTEVLPLWTPEARQAAFCRAAWAELDRLGVSATVTSVTPIAQGILRLPPDPDGVSLQVAQVVIQVDLHPATSGLTPVASTMETASFEVRQAIEHVRAARTPPASTPEGQ